jgi:hypothetical protein
MMLRDLAAVLIDLQAGMQALARSSASGVRINEASMTLPVDTAVRFEDGGCTLMADVTRSYAGAGWQTAPSRLVLAWAEVPTEDLP